MVVGLVPRRSRLARLPSAARVRCGRRRADHLVGLGCGAVRHRREDRSDQCDDESGGAAEQHGQRTRTLEDREPEPAQATRSTHVREAIAVGEQCLSDRGDLGDGDDEPPGAEEHGNEAARCTHRADEDPDQQEYRHHQSRCRDDPADPDHSRTRLRREPPGEAGQRELEQMIARELVRSGMSDQVVDCPLVASGRQDYQLGQGRSKCDQKSGCTSHSRSIGRTRPRAKRAARVAHGDLTPVHDRMEIPAKGAHVADDGPPVRARATNGLVIARDAVRRAWQWQRKHHIDRRLVIGLLALLGATLAIALAGNVHHQVGPVKAQFALRPTLHGGTEVDVPPLGRLTMRSHLGPLRVRATVTGISLTDAQRVLTGGVSRDALAKQVDRDVRDAMIALLTKSLIVALLGGTGLVLLTFRSWRPTAAAAVTTVGALLACGGLTAITWNTKALSQPKFTGVLASAPSLIGNIDDIQNRFDSYRAELSKIVTNVSKLYNVASTLPTAPQGNATPVLDRIVAPDYSLFMLSTFFFGKKKKSFFALWLGVKDLYPEAFWTSYWSEQIFRAYGYSQYAKRQDFTKAKKIGYRLPFSFIQKDWRSVEQSALVKAHQSIYSADWHAKNSLHPYLEIAFLEFMS